MIDLLASRLLIVIPLATMLLIYNIAPNALTESMSAKVTFAEANLFQWFTEFTYEVDAPDYAKELASKTTEKHYKLYKVSYEISGTKVSAVLVKVHVKSKPINDEETKIDFTAKAKHVYAKNDHFNIKKERAQVSGYSVLNSKTEKLSIHVPWAEILKNIV